MACSFQRWVRHAGALVLVLTWTWEAAAQPRPEPPARFDVKRFVDIDRLVSEALATRAMPGAVVVVGDHRGVVYQKAFGQRALEPAVEPMTLETIFDLASLTKVVATTTAVMQLVETGRLALSDPVARFIPEFDRYGKGAVTISHLLTHTSGLRPDLDLSFEWQGQSEAIRLACAEVLTATPGQRFVYSDINFFLLGEIVERITGLRLDRYARQHIFAPLRMVDATFLPPAEWRQRIAPTQWCTLLGWPCDGPNRIMLRGVVHDPTARRMAGVAGHAGLFASAADLVRFARFLLGRGTLDGVPVLSPLSVTRMTSPITTGDPASVRGLGWDIDSAFSTNRGELIWARSFGHTGFTGTSIWVDPTLDLFVLFLSNRVHPHGGGDVTGLRGRVASVAAAALRDVPVNGAPTSTLVKSPDLPVQTRRRTEPVMAGIDVLRAEGFKRLAGKRVGLVTNQTGRAADGTSTIDLLHAAPGVSLVALFSPEHGIRGTEDALIESSRDAKTGLTIHSLYGQTRRPTAAMLEGIDTLVIDLQDVGARFYTYTTTMAYVLEEAARHRLEVVVLDRPNPLNGWQIEGPTLDDDALGFTGYFPMPIRHGMTVGELARLFNGENKIDAALTVVPMRGWTRDTWFDSAGLPWVNPSPNMRNLTEAILYPGIGAFERANVSVGRGTDTPFEQVGAPWIDGVALARALNARGLAGVSFYPVSFVPSSSQYAGQTCQGVFIMVTNRTALRPVTVGLELAAALVKLHPSMFALGDTATLFGSRDGLRRLLAGDDAATIAAGWAADEARWRLRRARYLLYRE